MSTAAQTNDPVAAFNSHLAHAKINALRLLQDLMASLTDPDASVGAALREIRLAATAILRAQPIKHAAPPHRAPRPTRPERAGAQAPREQREATAPAPPHTSDPFPSTPDASRLDASPPPTHPTYRHNLNPTFRAARNDVRELIRAGVPEIIRLFLPSRAPPLSGTATVSQGYQTRTNPSGTIDA